MNGHDRPDEPRPDMLGETWDAPDPALDDRLRSAFGPITPLLPPVYGFERVLLRARRRRQRRTWIAVSCAMAFCVVVTGGVTAGLGLADRGIQSAAGCDNAPKSLTAWQVPAAADDGHFGTSAPGGDLGIGLGREAMNRRSEWAIGGVLTAAALGGGIFAGCSGSGSSGTPSADSSQSTPSQSQGAALLPSGTPSATGQTTSGSPSAKPSATASATPQCHTTDLTAAVSILQDSAAMGTELMNVTLTNTSGHSCTVYGYPGLALEDQNRAIQTTKVTRTSGTEKTILVENGGSVSTTVSFDFDMPASDEPQTGDCEAPSVYMEITPPDETTQLETTISGGPVTVCQHGALNVFPFIPGQTGPNE